jgi:hypothetical protein
MTPCICVFDSRKPDEDQREWLKRCMCQSHWMQTDYYAAKRGLRETILTHELLDLITLMPESQTQEIVNYIEDLRRTRSQNADSTSSDIHRGTRILETKSDNRE